MSPEAFLLVGGPIALLLWFWCLWWYDRRQAATSPNKETEDELDRPVYVTRFGPRRMTHQSWADAQAYIAYTEGIVNWPHTLECPRPKNTRQAIDWLVAGHRIEIPAPAPVRDARASALMWGLPIADWDRLKTQRVDQVLLRVWLEAPATETTDGDPEDD